MGNLDRALVSLQDQGRVSVDSQIHPRIGMLNFWPWIVAAGAFAAWFSHRYAWWSLTVSWAHPRILMYHMISRPVRGARYNSMRVSPENFEYQLKWLKDHGFEFLTMADIAKGVPRERVVVLTFDDGFEDNYTAAFPLLKKYGARATLYLVAERDDGRDWSAQKKAHHNSGELLREAKLSDEQVREMVNSGVFELGAHTMTHVNLSKASLEEKRSEIIGSKTALENQFGAAVTSFAYPFGIWDQQDRDVVEEGGFISAVTTDRGVTSYPYKDALELKRIKVSGKEGMYSFQLRLRTGQRSLWK